MSKTLIFHDTYLMRGGAERMNIELAKGLNADIATAIWSNECYDARSMGFEGKIFKLDPGWSKGILGFLLMKWRFLRSDDITTNYNTILFSNEAITGIWKTKPETKTYYYAHSISRHLFDQWSQYFAKVPLLLRPFFLIFSSLLKWIYLKELSKIGTIFVNSELNKKRMKEWCKRDDAIVIYPSVDIKKFQIFDENSISQIIAKEGILFQNKEYYISFSRLTHAKRIDTIIRVFAQMPDKNIIILYGEHDSQKKEFMSLGEGYPNILFHKMIDGNNLPHIISGAIASICVSREEDFGMVAIESMACGVPVIAVNEGGYKESMLAGKTGYMIDPIGLEENLITIIQYTDKNLFKNMQETCRKRALDFSTDRMLAEIRKYIE